MYSSSTGWRTSTGWGGISPGSPPLRGNDLFTNTSGRGGGDGDQTFKFISGTFFLCERPDMVGVTHHSLIFTEIGEEYESHRKQTIETERLILRRFRKRRTAQFEIWAGDRR
jgi:hypothetical protein